MKKNKQMVRLLQFSSEFKTFIMTMKICMFFLFALSFQMMAINSKAQDAIIELRSTSMTIGEFIEEIERQTDYLVVYSNREIDVNREIHFKSNNNKVSDYLDL